MIWRWFIAKERTTNLNLIVPRNSNLDLILRDFNGAINKLADSIGGGLQAIAVALATPQDNSEQVQQAINQYASRIGSQEAALKDAVEKHKGD